MAKKQLPEGYDKSKNYTLEEAVELLPQLSTSKFVGSVDIDILLDLSDKQKKETLKGGVTLPHQFGEDTKVIVFAEEADAKKAKAAGAVDAGLDDLVKKVEAGKIDYDVVLATPAVMPTIAKLGKVLGPKGLMPNPGSKTIVTDIEGSIKTFLAGRQNFKMNDQGTVRARVAKLDMKPEEIAANITAFLDAVTAEAKKFGPQPIKKITLSPTMGAGVRLEISSAS